MKKRMLQMITRSDWAGGQKVLYALVYGLLKYYPDEFEIEVACGKEHGTLISELEKLHVRVHVIPNLVRAISPLKDFRAFLQIYKLMRQQKYDVVHVHSSKAGFLGRIAAKLNRVPKIVYTVHGWWPIEQYGGWKRRIFILVERVAANFCDKLVFLCHSDMVKAKNWKIGKEKQYVIIPNAIIPIETSKLERGKLRKELGIPEDVKIIGNVARLDRQKNPVRFLEIAREILKVRSDVRFVWIGGSIVDDACGEHVKQWLSDNPREAEFIHFLPFRKDSMELMFDFDVLLITSYAEGLPLVALEAKNLGIRVASTNVGCLKEIADCVGDNSESLVDCTLNLLDAASKSKTTEVSSFQNFILSHYGVFVEEF